MTTRLSRIRKIYEQLINMNGSSEERQDDGKFEKLLDKVEDAVQAHIYEVA